MQPCYLAHSAEHLSSGRAPTPLLSQSVICLSLLSHSNLFKFPPQPLKVRNLCGCHAHCICFQKPSVKILHCTILAVNTVSSQLTVAPLPSYRATRAGHRASSIEHRASIKLLSTLDLDAPELDRPLGLGANAVSVPLRILLSRPGRSVSLTGTSSSDPTSFEGVRSLGLWK